MLSKTWIPPSSTFFGNFYEVHRLIDGPWNPFFSYLLYCTISSFRVFIINAPLYLQVSHNFLHIFFFWSQKAFYEIRLQQMIVDRFWNIIAQIEVHRLLIRCVLRQNDYLDFDEFATLQIKSCVNHVYLPWYESYQTDCFDTSYKGTQQVWLFLRKSLVIFKILDLTTLLI